MLGFPLVKSCILYSEIRYKCHVCYPLVPYLTQQILIAIFTEKNGEVIKEQEHGKVVMYS